MAARDTVLLVIDVQGKLASLMHGHEGLFVNIGHMIKIAQALDVPVLWTEQAPDKIGATIEPIAQLLFPMVKPVHKRTFSCYACLELRAQLDAAGRRKVLVAGIEAHVCVYQTVRDLKRHGYAVHLITDAVSSRTQANRDMALARMRQEGAVLTSTEMAACELLGSADHPKFREVMAYIKR